MNFAATPETEPFWASARDEVLSVPFCLRCERFFLYPRPFCPRCWSDGVEWRRVSGRGRVASYTVVRRQPPDVEDDVPYVVAVIELDEGVQLMSHVVDFPGDPTTIPLDLPVEVAFDHARALARPVFRQRAPTR
jgi:uncharacterized OB-fold protein